VCPLADSYSATAAREAGSLAELAADRKFARYINLDSCYSFQPVVVEMLGLIKDSAHEFLFYLGCKFFSSQAMIERAAFCFRKSLS